MGLLWFLVGSALDNTKGTDTLLDGGIMWSIIEDALDTKDNNKK